MQDKIQQIRARCLQAMARAEELYGVDLSDAELRFDLKGRSAGQAWMHGERVGMRFNRDMIAREAFNHVLNHTVPHEVAHLVCFKNPRLGQNHDSGWERVCVSLGGSGNRSHKEKVVYGKGATYEYTTDRGHKVRLSERRHMKVQAGTPLMYRGGLGTVQVGCAYSIVGIRGKSLANPIVKQAMNHPSVIEEAIRAPMPDAAEMARRAAMVEELRRRQLAAKAVQTSVTVPNPAVTVRPAVAGESKAATSRRIMLSGYRGGQSYETIIAAMIVANGYDRQLARATFKANAPKVGIPMSFYA